MRAKGDHSRHAASCQTNPVAVSGLSSRRQKSAFYDYFIRLCAMGTRPAAGNAPPGEVRSQDVRWWLLQLRCKDVSQVAARQIVAAAWRGVRVDQVPTPKLRIVSNTGRIWAR